MLEKERRARGGAASTGGRVAGAEEEDLEYIERSGRQMAWVAGWMGERSLRDADWASIEGP